MVSKPFQSFLKRLIDFQGRRRFRRKTRRSGRLVDLFRQSSHCHAAVETLEDRLLLSASSLTMNPPFRLGGQTMPLSSAQPVASSTAQPASATTSTPTQIKSNANSPPTVTAPSSEVVVSTSTFGFSEYAIGIGDAAASGSSDSVTVTASQGTLSVAPASGLGITGNSTTSLTLTGTLATMGEALWVLVYTPTPGYLGTDSLQISLTNANDGLTGSATVAMHVDALPRLLNVPQSSVVTENSSLNFGNTISLTDASATGASDSLTVSPMSGTVTLGSTTGLTFTAGSNNSRYITVSGTLNDLNAALNGLVYTPELGFYGNDVLYIGALDTVDGLATAGTVDLSVAGLPAPVVTAPSTTSVTENGSISFPNGSIAISDSEDTGSSADSLSLSVSKGGLTLGSTSGLTFATGSNGSSSMTVTGTLANLNLALSGLVYSPNSTYIGADTLNISAVDAWDDQKGSTSVSLTVNALPSPIVSAPSNAAVNENNLLTFGTGALSLTDSSASGTSDELTLSVASGTLTLGSTNGLTFNSGSNSSSSISITGTLANLNAALDGLVYAPNAGEIGFDSLQIAVNDSGDALSASAAVRITIGGGTPPVVTAPASIYAGQDDPYNVDDSINLADAGAWGESDSLTLTATNGTISLTYIGDITFTSGSNNSSSMTINGPLQDLEDSVFWAEYTPNTNYVGPDTLQLTLTNALDNLKGSASVSIDDVYTPNVSAQSGMWELENNPYVIGSSSIKLTDLAATNTSDSMTLFLNNSSITLASTTGLTFTSGANGESDMTVTGSIADLNAAVDGLSIALPDYFPPTLHISLSDSVDGFSAGWFAYVIAVPNPPPTIAAPSMVSVPVNGSFTFSAGAVSVTDPASTTESVPLSVSDGTLTLGSTNGLTFTSGSDGSSSMTVSGTLANVNAALNGLVYTANPGYTGSDSLVMFADSTAYREWGEAIVTINVGDQPSVSAPSSQFVAENGSLLLNNSIILSDPEAAGLSDSVSLSVANGTIELGSTAGITIVSGANNSSSMTISGTLANLNSALNLQYFPNSNYLGADSLQLSLTDLGDSLTQPASIALTVVAPPAISAPARASLNENGSFTFVGTISATDATAAGSSDSVSLSVADGTLTLGSTTGIAFSSGSNGSSSMTIDGTLTSLNAALGGLVYAPNLNYVGADSLQISANDSIDGLAGSGSVALTVNAVPPPAVTAPPTASLNENGSYTFSGSAISLADSIASGTSDSVSLSVVNGTLTLGSTGGITFSSGSNGSSSMRITGTLANLNAAFAGLVYAPHLDYVGSDTLQISVTDSIDRLNGSGSVALTINALPLPGVTAPPTASLKENSSYTFSGSAISLADATASGTSDSLSLSVMDGKLTLATTSGLTVSSGSNNSSSMTVTGTLANLKAAVSSLVYTPTSGFSGHDTLAISLADSVDKLTGSASVQLAVNPYVTAPATANVLENGSYSFSSSGGDPISATDGGAVGTSDSLTLTVLHGKLTLGSLTGLTITSGANGSSSITVQGTLANLNAALNGLVYAPATSYTGSDTLTVTVNNASDGLSGSASVALTVTMKKIIGAVVIASPVVAPTDTTTADDPDQWAGVSAAVDVLNE
jgi:hypothetical protein